MKIKIYAIQSQLSNQRILLENTNILINNLKDYEIETEIVNNVEDLYENADLSLILVQSGGSENLFIENFGKFKEPYYFLTYGENNSLAASLEIMAFLKNHNLKGEVLHGENEYLAKRIKTLAVAPSNKKAEANLGLIGKPSDWLISSDVDKNIALEKFGINLVYVPIQELSQEYEKNIAFENEKVLGGHPFDPKEISKAEHLYNAIKTIVKKYDLKGFAIRCFDLLGSLKTTACLALSHFNDDGIIGTCEGDAPSLIGMYLVRKILNEPSFQSNPSKINVDKNEILLAHCTIPLKMCKSFDLDTHYESGIGVAIHGEVKEGDATIFRLNSALNECFIQEGTIEKNQYKDRLCRTQIICHFPELNKMLTSPLGNHELIILGHHKEKLLKYLSEKGVKII